MIATIQMKPRSQIPGIRFTRFGLHSERASAFSAYSLSSVSTFPKADLSFHQATHDEYRFVANRLLTLARFNLGYVAKVAKALYFGSGAHIASFDRRIEFCVSTGKTVFPNAKPGIRFKAIPKEMQPRPEQAGIAKHGFRAFTGPPGVCFLRMPNWFLILIAATLSVAPWLKRRFSLSTLLIAMTLVALLLGMIAAST